MQKDNSTTSKFIPGAEGERPRSQPAVSRNSGGTSKFLQRFEEDESQRRKRLEGQEGPGGGKRTVVRVENSVTALGQDGKPYTIKEEANKTAWIDRALDALDKPGVTNGKNGGDPQAAEKRQLLEKVRDMYHAGQFTNRALLDMRGAYEHGAGALPAFGRSPARPAMGPLEALREQAGTAIAFNTAERDQQRQLRGQTGPIRLGATASLQDIARGTAIMAGKSNEKLDGSGALAKQKSGIASRFLKNDAEAPREQARGPARTHRAPPARGPRP